MENHEDGAFEQLSAAFKIHGQDPEDSATQKTSGRQTPSAKRIDGATESITAITSAALPGLAGVASAIAAENQPRQG